MEQTQAITKPIQDRERLTAEAGPFFSFAGEPRWVDNLAAVFLFFVGVLEGSSLNKLCSSDCKSGESLMLSSSPQSDSLPSWIIDNISPLDLPECPLRIDNSEGSKTPSQKKVVLDQLQALIKPQGRNNKM